MNTKDNPADDPTRDRPVRDPVEPLPEWASQIEAGIYESFDLWLQHQGADPMEIARLPAEPARPPVLPEPPSERHLRRREASRRTRQGKGSFAPPVAAVVSRGEPWLPCRKLSADVVAELSKFPPEQFVLPPGRTLVEALALPGHLDIFSGSRGAAKALAARSGRFVLTFDILHSASENLLDQSVRSRIERLMRLGAFLTLTGGPVCSSFSRAVRPAVRDRTHLRGRPGISSAMQIKVDQGNSFSDWVCFLADLGDELGLLVWIENPRTSMMWLQVLWEDLIASGRCSWFITDYCRWGTAWRKRTSFCTNISTLRDQRCYCECSTPHQHLVGYSKRHGCSWTKVAEPYPSSLCAYLARAVVEALKPVERQRRLDVAACARCNGRIGEASHPGPRPRRMRTSLDNLEEVSRVQPATRVLQQRVYNMYGRWLEDQLSPATLIILCMTIHHYKCFFCEPLAIICFLQARPCIFFAI